MKVPPKRKGNSPSSTAPTSPIGALNESPSEKEGKCQKITCSVLRYTSLNESPSEKEGKSAATVEVARLSCCSPSMKVPPKRKGNFSVEAALMRSAHTLNESPSEKEGK